MGTKKIGKTLKWFAYILFAFILFCLQNSPERFEILSGVLFLLPLVVAVSCFERVLPSAVFAVVVGLFWDYSAQRIFGFNALLLCVLSVAVSLAMKYYVRPVYLSVAVASAAAALVHTLSDFFFFFVLKGYEGTFKLFVNQYVPMFFKTALFGAGICYVVMKIYSLSPNRARFDEE